MLRASNHSNSPFRLFQNSDFRYSYNPANSIRIYYRLLYYLGNRNHANTIFNICKNRKSNIKTKDSSRKILFIKKSLNHSLYITQKRFIPIITNNHIEQISSSGKRYLSFLTFRPPILSKQTIHLPPIDHLFTLNTWFLSLKKTIFTIMATPFSSKDDTL